MHATERSKAAIRFFRQRSKLDTMRNRVQSSPFDVYLGCKQQLHLQHNRSDNKRIS